MNQAEGFAAIPNWIVRDGSIPPQAKIVLMVIASHAGRSGATRLRKETIVEESGLSRATVTRYLRWLSENELLDVTANYVDKGRGSNTYRPVMFRTDVEPLFMVVEEDSEVEHPGSEVAEPRLSAIRTSAHRDPAEEEPSKKNTLRTPPTPQGADTDADFAEFWAAYPRKKEKAAARKTFARHAKKVPAGTIIAAARAYAEECRVEKRAEQFVKYPSSWLNVEPWKDDPVDAEAERTQRLRELIKNRSV